MYLITFHTNFDANAFSRKVKTMGTARMKPVPRQLSSSCGTCVVFDPADADFSPEALSDMAFEKFYKVSGSDYELLYEKE